MIAERIKMNGVMRGGVIVPDSRLILPEGTEVEISFPAAELPQELQEEFAAWDRASADAWAMMDTWEAEANP